MISLFAQADLGSFVGICLKGRIPTVSYILSCMVFSVLVRQLQLLSLVRVMNNEKALS